MTQYYRVMLGKGGIYSAQALAGNFVGADYQINQDLTSDLPDDWRAFNKKFIPIFLAGHPGKTKIGAGLACGAIWTICRGMEKGDILLSPDGTGTYNVAKVTGDYHYAPGGPLPHRRTVQWVDKSIARSAMSDVLQSATRSAGTVADVTQYAVEIEKLLGGSQVPGALVSVDGVIEDPAAFALEKHLEEFLVANWGQTDLGKKYDIFSEDGELVGQQYLTDTGPVDILAIRKDKKELLVVELKRGRASDAVVGQVLRYMGFVMQELAEPGQAVRGVIIALEDDQRLRRALAASPTIEFLRYEITFKLIKA
jgi:restriction system protein